MTPTTMRVYGATAGGGVPIWLPLPLFGFAAVVVVAQVQAEKRFG